MMKILGFDSDLRHADHCYCPLVRSPEDPFGRYMYAIGGNPAAAGSRSMIRVLPFLLISFRHIHSSRGIVLASMTQQCMASTGSGYETEVITAAVIGGVSLLGGEGTVPGAIFGAVIVGLLNNGLNLMSVPSPEHGLVKGIVIIAAVAFDALQHQDQAKRFSFFSFGKSKKTA